MPENLKYTEQELIKGLQNRNKKFFDYLYDQYSGALNGIICRMIKDSKLSDEVLQQTFAKIWHLVKSYDSGKGRLFTWMVKIAKLQAADTIRNNSYLLHSNSLNNDALNDSLKRDYAANAAYSFTIRKQENNFENDSKQIINLVYFENYSQEDISKRLGIPLETVKTNLRMAIMEIRKSVHFKV